MDKHDIYLNTSSQMRGAISEYIEAARSIEATDQQILDDIADVCNDAGLKVESIIAEN